MNLKELVEQIRRMQSLGWASQRQALYARHAPQQRRGRSYPRKITQERERARRRRQIARGILRAG
jgi:hypothetical protein